ncbi:hypothetical protein PHSY_003346 [Pseudozyma hubeiensis SY62]|uniref:Alpha/beta hydrolase fold-3 domain-containing protein n=1 Tax=Pseudozyma hubeiensis (strain SY62) TaxID=1305764 RepID=R9PCH4_PSEHS|nr:hypothetical protein PHSY_003346 [Pseudozyma hubeiensis SY62]GAC95770.1 hypothetical protein PHSY_003346 [Pseudozyma hubeiensis SY62]
MSVASKAVNASTGFQLLRNPTNPSPEEVASALKLVRSGGITHPQTAVPNRSLTIPSHTTSRSIKVDIYNPASLPDTTPRPVILNWHGSGFVVDRFGADADVNRWLVDELKTATVVDADYVKAPEHPFPEGIHDAVSAVKWVIAQPWFDGQLVVKGHSAGANFALCLSSRSIALSLGLTEEEYSHIKACVTLYPPTDSSIPLSEKPTNEEGELPGIPMSPLSAQIMHFFFGAYLGWDEATQLQMGKDPRVSPAKASTESFEVPCYIIACEHDPLGPEAKAFAHRLMQADKKHKFYWAQGVGHSYETRIPDVRDEKVLESAGGKSKVESFAGMLEFIRENVKGVQE